MIPTQILRVLSTIRMYDVRALLMGGQACVLYGAAEYSRDLDLAVLATPEALPTLREALESLNAAVIAVPSFDVAYLDRGHAVHFSIPDGSTSPLRVDIMSRLRGVDAFPVLWERRTTIALPTGAGDAEVLVDVMALEDLVAAKKTQRDKDWPMLRRLVDASYAAARDDAVSDAQVDFWLAELRSPAFLAEVIARYPEAAARSSRSVVRAALNHDDMDVALAAEQVQIMVQDRAYWAPLRRELEALRFAARRTRE
ncbi:hypothetical protein [Gemmatimonas sp.]|uniref:hypothetical protein n=1 Tax=Gemmatimonas sp. TaxID=1962908 RepID=UPI00398377E1